MKIYNFFIVFFITGCFAVLGFFPVHASTSEYAYKTSVRHIEGGGIGYKDGYSTLEAFLAPQSTMVTLMPFLNIRGHIFNEGKIASNVGFGLRTIKAQRVYGLNAYYDYRKAKKSNYNQVGFGVESLGKYWDLRCNGYFPINKKVTPVSAFTFQQFSGNSMILSQKYQCPMTGFNATIGVHLGNYRSFDFYTSAGPYYFSNYDEHLWGGKARMSCTYKEYVTLELSNSYDKKFRNKFQCQLSLSLPFGKSSKKEGGYDKVVSFSRMMQRVEREEILVVGRTKKCCPATDPQTHNPLTFVFVNNMSNSLGTYESPYPTLELAQNNSKPGDIIYVFPGDGTTRGMDAGIVLKRNQKLWGAGIEHTLSTAQGSFIIPAQSSTAPIITNTDFDTQGHAVTLDTANQLRGLSISGAIASGVFGTNIDWLDITECIVRENNVFAVDASCVGSARVTYVNNLIKNNVNGINNVFEGPSTLFVSNNVFSGTTSTSAAPLSITAGIAPLEATIKNNRITNNVCSAIRCTLADTDNAQLLITNNIISGNGTGALGALGSPITINPNNTNAGNCTIILTNNNISFNEGSALYCFNGSFNDFKIHASGNRINDNTGAGLVCATGAHTFSLSAENNIIANLEDNGIATTGGITMEKADITITNNSITGIANASNGIAVTHEGTTLNLTVRDNDISQTEGSGVLLYPSNFIENVTVDVTGNTLNNHQNMSSNAASGIDLEQYTYLSATIKDNTLLENASPSIFVGSSDTDPVTCLQLSGNSNDANFILSNNTGTFNLSPCDVSTLNSGPIDMVGTITIVQSCPSAIPCP